MAAGYGDRFSALPDYAAERRKAATRLAVPDRRPRVRRSRRIHQRGDAAEGRRYPLHLFAAPDRVRARCRDRQAALEVRSADPAQSNLPASDLPRRLLSRDRRRRDRGRRRAGAAECPRRIFLPTNDGRMIALNAETGAPCDGFGDHGQIDLKEGKTSRRLGFYEGTSPPVVTDKMLVMGGAVIDNYSTQRPSGVIRGFDIYSGKLLWAFDAGNPDPNEMPSATHHFTAGSPNAWASRRPMRSSAWSMCRSACGAATSGAASARRRGALWEPRWSRSTSPPASCVWSYQNVHHDLWDMDMPSQPSLVDMHTANGIVPAIYAPAKTGNIFVLDRRDGQLIVPAPETPVPQGAAPGDRLSPTQPFSELTFRPGEADRRGHVGRDDVRPAGLPHLFHRLRYEGPFTPPSSRARWCSRAISACSNGAASRSIRCARSRSPTRCRCLSSPS